MGLVFVIIGAMSMMTVGTYLRKIREEKGLSLEDIATGTNVRYSYLQAIENDQLDQFPSMAQAKGFARLYASYLGLNTRDVFEEVERLNQPERKKELSEQNTATASQPMPNETSGRIRNHLPKARKTPSPSEPKLEGTTPIKPIELPVSQVIFNEIGRELKHQREALGLSLEDVERLTNIREFFLYALENGQIDDLPSTVQGRGMLNNYASFLNLNSESLQLHFAEGVQQQRLEKNRLEEKEKKGVKVVGKAPLSGWRRFLTPDLLVGGTVFLVLFSLVIWGALQMIHMTNPEPLPTLSSISDILVGGSETPDAETTAGASLEANTPVTSTPSLFSTPPVDLAAALSTPGSGMIQVVVVAYQRAYMKVTVDGVDAFAGRVIPGNVYSFSGDQKITLLTGNAAALQVYYNQQDQGMLGPMGTVLELEFTRDAMVTPTPKFSPTPTLTPLPTFTALPTNTPPPTATIPTVTITPARTVIP